MKSMGRSYQNAPALPDFAYHCTTLGLEEPALGITKLVPLKLTRNALPAYGFPFTLPLPSFEISTQDA